MDKNTLLIENTDFKSLDIKDINSFIKIHDLFLTEKDKANLLIDFQLAKNDLLSSGGNAEKADIAKKTKNSKETNNINYESDTSVVNNVDDLTEHERIARSVFRRLLLRNAQLRFITHLTKQHFINSNIEKENNPSLAKTQGVHNNPDKKDDSEFRSYKHAITDLFVEKAISYLDIQADRYKNNGKKAYFYGLISILIGIGTSGILFGKTIFFYKPIELSEILSIFITAFTFYGFIVLIAVGLWRYGKAMLDQSERLLEKKHALRQGRLFVHLHDAKNMTFDEMEKAFNWNVNNSNAFSNMSTDAKAPWGAIISEAIKLGFETAVRGIKTKEEISNNTNPNPIPGG